MCIPIGKLSLYVAAAGIHPARTVPSRWTFSAHTHTHTRIRMAPNINRHISLSHGEEVDSIEAIAKTYIEGQTSLALTFSNSDLGVNGMGIPIGKLSLYVAAAGIHPARTLPITVDFGTNNERYRQDPMYIGSRKPRVEDEVSSKSVCVWVGVCFPLPLPLPPTSLSLCRCVCMGGGVHSYPACTLPITVDFGTNNERYRQDPMYIGSRKPRVEDEVSSKSVWLDLDR